MAFNKKKNFINAQSTVVASAYDCSGAGGRKLVRLDNGVLLAAASTSGAVYVYSSLNGGKTWRLACSLGLAYTSIVFALTTYKNIVCIITCNTVASYASNYVNTYAISSDGIGTMISGGQLDTGQNSFGTGCSITVDKFGTLHAAWCSKNSSYPNSFNIRYSKSTDGGVTWAGVTQITSSNTSGTNRIRPCIVINALRNPVIIYDYTSSSSTYGICGMYYTGSAWAYVGGGTEYVYNGGAYFQYVPSAVVDSKGIIHVVWAGIDSTDDVYDNIRYSKSIDNGATWDTATKLTSGNTTNCRAPSISADNYRNLGIIFARGTGTNYYESLITAKAGIFSNYIHLTGAQAHQNMSQVLEHCDNVDSPPFIWQDNAASAIKFLSDSRIDAKRKLLNPWEADSNTTDKSQQVSLRPRRTIPVQYP